MGRRKKMRFQPSKEGMRYAITAIKRYTEMRQFCDKFEVMYPSLLKKGKVRTEAFEEMDCLSEDTFLMPDLAPCDADKMDDYLANREMVYLFEYSLQQLDDVVRQIAESLFIKKMSWEEVMQKHCVSRMTVSRYRKAALQQMAIVVDNYMEWKARSLFA